MCGRLLPIGLKIVVAEGLDAIARLARTDTPSSFLCHLPKIIIHHQMLIYYQLSFILPIWLCCHSLSDQVLSISMWGSSQEKENYHDHCHCHCHFISSIVIVISINKVWGFRVWFGRLERSIERGIPGGSVGERDDCLRPRAFERGRRFEERAFRWKIGRRGGGAWTLMYLVTWGHGSDGPSPLKRGGWSPHKLIRGSSMQIHVKIITVVVGLYEFLILQAILHRLSIGPCDSLSSYYWNS